MEYVLIATDSDVLAADLDATLGDDQCEVGRVNSGAEVFGSVRTRQPDLVVLDLQIGNMGGMATSLHLRNEAGGRRLAPQRILLLLDREADVFLARESEADGWMIKPIDSFRLRRAAQAVADGRVWREHADGTIEEGETVVHTRTEELGEWKEWTERPAETAVPGHFQTREWEERPKKPEGRRLRRRS